MNLNHVPRRWLQLLHIFYIVIDVGLICFILATHLGHSDNTHLINHWGLTQAVAAVAALHLAYGTLVYPWLQKRNTWVATIISQVFFDLIVATIIQDSNNNNLVYRIGWMIIVGLSSMLGIYMVVAEVFIDSFLNFLTDVGYVKPSSYSTSTEWILTVCVALVGIIGWLIIRNFYEKTDNSELSALSRRLSQEQQRSNLIISSIADGVIVFDISGKISIINPAASSLTEWPVNDALNLDIHLVMKLAQENGKPLDTGADVFSQVLSNKQPEHHNVTLIGQHDKQTIVSLSVSPVILSGSDVAGAVAVFRDVTEERKEEQQRADFISTASHEMRTPVAAIEGYLALALNSKVSTVDAKARGFLEKAHESTQHLGQLFQDLLTSAKAEDGRLSNHPKVVEMSGFTRQLTEDLRFAAQKKQLGMEFLIGNNDVIDASEGGVKTVVQPLYYVHVDPDRLREVITNLFDNAVKYTEQGKITIGLTADDKVVQFSIRDTGAGIPADDIPHLFQKFYRVDNSATRTIGGTGLGLFISRKIVELYHGRIWVESEMGKGSTFFINLPRLSPQKASQLQATEAAASPLSNITSLTSS